MKSIFSFLFLAVFYVLPAHAGFPADRTEEAAIKAVEAQILAPQSALGAAHLTMLKNNYSAAAQSSSTKGVTLTELTSRTDVESQVLVRKPYSVLTAGGETVGSITVLVKVELLTDEDTGDVISTSAQVIESTVKVNSIF